MADQRSDVDDPSLHQADSAGIGVFHAPHQLDRQPFAPHRRRCQRREAETPSIAIMADEFSKLCNSFSIGSNDMTQGILMIDRDSERLGQMGYFDERDPAIKRIIAHLIKVAHKNRVKVSICGEGPSNLPELVYAPGRPNPCQPEV